MTKKKPNFFIVGGPKCGTTALAQYLSDHPEAFMSEPKEPHFYNTDTSNSDIRDPAQYLALFAQVNAQHKVIGEASVWYLYSKVAARNIEQDIPDAKYIVMLRNPVDMAYSLHEQMVFSSYENVANFETAWAMQDERREGRKVPTFCPDKSLILYKDACSLGSQLQRLLADVESHRVLILFQDDLKSDPSTLWKSVQAFLGLAEDGRQVFPVVNAAKKRRSRLLKMANDTYAAIRKRFKLRPLGLGIFAAINRWNIKERARMPMRDEFRVTLAEEFFSEVKLLETITGRDLKHWYPKPCNTPK